MNIDRRFIQEDGIGIFTGNELIVKGALEGRMGLMTGYPGSPVAEVFDAAERVKELLIEKGVLVQIANNEALGAARLNGAQMEAIRSVAVMKSVGVHVASDALALGNMAGTGEGAAAVVVIGDDTWSEGTQVPADSRFIAKHLYMPVMEPSTFQEIKDWMQVAFELSEKTRLYMAFLVTSNQADGGGTVYVSPNDYPERSTKNKVTLDPHSISPDDRVIIPPHTVVKETEVLEKRFPKLLSLAREYDLNRILFAPETGKKRVGFVSSSLAYCYLEHALSLVGLEGAFPILKYGITYPIDTEILRDFVGMVDEVYVVEEKRGFLEEQVSAALQNMHQQGQVGDFCVWGKKFREGIGFPDSKGMNPGIVLQVLAPVLKGLDDPTVAIDGQHIDAIVSRMIETESYDLEASVRTPSFCPGCPHRDSASVLNKIIDDFENTDYMRSQHDQDPVSLIFHGDIGCYSLLKYEPFDRLMHNLSGMGLGGGTGAGIDPFINNKQLVFMGDSTFFHSGMTAISDAIKHGQDITFVILDNKTTAMTGHQPTPGVDIDIMGQPTFAQDIEEVVRGLGGGIEAHAPAIIVRMNPSDREAYRDVLEAALLMDGVKIVIADKECGITFHRRRRSEAGREIKENGFLAEEAHINVTPEVCEYCLECTQATGCSGLATEETLHGKKITTDLSLCVADGACTRVEVANGDKTCPSFEQVTITRKQAPVVQMESIDLTDIPQPPVLGFDTTWYAYIAGVGGMGINTIAAILAVAGAREGYTVRFTNKKGLAIRNGSVYSHVSFSNDERAISQLTPYGHADLLLGLDIVEAVRGLDPKGTGRVASPACTTAVVETGKRDTILTLTGKDDFDVSELELILKRYTKEETYFGMDLGEISERFLGNKIYANSILLGAAFQRGALPLTHENICWAMKQNIKPSDLDANLKAFEMGRKAAVDPNAFLRSTPPTTLEGFVDDKMGILAQDRGREIAQAYQTMALEVSDWKVDETSKVQFALGVYDLIQWDGPEYAQQYIHHVREVYKNDNIGNAFAATDAVIPNLARVMAYKDEIYVAHLLTSEEKRRRDFERYDVDPARGDQISYVHLTRPHFEILGKDFKFSMDTKDWMLRFLRGMKFLRKWLPAWHQEEKDYRDWYVDLVKKFEYGGDDRYWVYVKILQLPDEVRGYLEVIWPKMQAARQMADYWLTGKGEPAKMDKSILDIEPVAEKV
ncbi:MAG: indolepyruvate ferredoxin oxidoreductase [Candidatus Latescibacteria bacterium]|nr:indolepyruvate ferredoxin oxidoreductase [Candidatus Latescibacterota bacterium]